MIAAPWVCCILSAARAVDDVVDEKVAKPRDCKRATRKARRAMRRGSELKWSTYRAIKQDER